MTLRFSNVAKLLGIAFAAFIVAALFAGLWFMGAVVVHDPEQQVILAQVTASDGRTQPLHRLPGRLFYTVPRLEGTIEVRCRKGKVARTGYVTPHFLTTATLVRGSDCDLRQVR